jgi:hypothetical protein
MFNSVKDVDTASMEDLEKIVTKGTGIYSLLADDLIVEHKKAEDTIQNIENIAESIAFAIKSRLQDGPLKEDVGDFMHLVAFDLGKEYYANYENFWVNGHD